MKLFTVKRLDDAFKLAANLHGKDKLIETPHASYTYHQIDSLSDMIAQDLLERKLTGVVAIFMGRSVDLIISILAVLKADLAYIAIDPAYPEVRIDYMINDLGCKAILTHFKNHVVLEKYQNIVIWYNATARMVSDRKNFEHLSKHNAIACILYTSGSTGNPKPVTLTHTGILNLLENQLHYFHVNHNDKILQFSSVSFDAFIAEMWIALLSGAVLVLPDEHYLSADVLANTIIFHKISFLIIPPSVLDTIDNPEKVCVSLRTVISVGEALTSVTLNRWFNHLQHLINAYGPSEATVCTTFYNYEKDVCVDNIIGKPLNNVFTYILDEQLNPLEAGEVGELYIGGKGLSPGYFNHPELDEQRFLQSPFDASQKLYKTGDLCRYLDNENLQYVGRADRQVKINGIRVELEEIENNLGKHHQINLCAVKVSEVGISKEKKLIAYITLKNQYKDLTLEKTLIASLREHLAKSLPISIIPHHYMLCPELPRLLSGKIDRNNLPEFHYQNLARINGEANSVISLYAKILAIDVNEISSDSNFFDLGGSSLSAIRLVSELRKQYEIDIPIEHFFNHPCVKDIFEYIQKNNEITLDEQDFLDKDLYFDFASIENMLINETKSPDNMKQFLLTGATGFLGSYLLASLLKHEPQALIHCLVRDKSDQTGMDRLISSLESYDIKDVDLSRVFVYHADLSQPALGLSETDYDHLSQIIDRIYHCGAFVNHLFAYNALRETNVLSAIELIKFSIKNKKKSIDYVSTMDITLLQDKDIKDKMGYIQTKWVAEHLLFQASHIFNLNINIYRPGNIIGDLSNGTMDPNTNHFLMFIKGCIQLGYVPARETVVEMTPVNLIADAIVRLSMQKSMKTLEIYPLHNPHNISWNEYIDILIDNGVVLKLVGMKHWIETCLSTINSDNALFPFKDFYKNNTSDLTHGLKDYHFKDELISLFKSLSINHPNNYRDLCAKQLQQLQKYGFLQLKSESCKIMTI